MLHLTFIPRVKAEPATTIDEISPAHAILLVRLRTTPVVAQRIAD
jgi:hypothetical protein